MHYGCKSVARRHVDVGSVAHILNNVAEVDQVGRVKNIASYWRTPSCRRSRRIGNGNVNRICVIEYLVVAGGAHESLVVFWKATRTEFLVVCEFQLTDHPAQLDLWPLDIHLVQNLFHFHHNLAISENDD